MLYKHEKILTEGLKEGNPQIFDYIFHYYYSGMVVFAMKYVNEKSIAEDIVQDFFVQLWIKREKIDINTSLKSYFFVSLKNRCIDYLRKKEKQNSTTTDAIGEIGKLTDERNLLIESELRNHINTAIDKLPPACREIFIMNRFEGLKASQIAEKRGTSIRTVETQIARALKIMRKELAPYLPACIIVLITGAM